MDSFDRLWPDGLVQSFWNYSALKQPRNIPFMGYEPNREFLLAFLAGTAVIVFFAYRRFNERSFDPAAADYRVLRELAPMDLRGSDLMLRAYARYAGALIAIYVALTFFGKLILQTVNSLPAAGLQVDVGSLNFDSPQWPLLISFGMVGFLPMLKPVEVIETRLRAWSHRSVGIPTQIADRTNRIKKALDALSGTAPGVAAAPAWLSKIATMQELARALRAHAQLQRLYDWSKDERAYWPAPEVRATLKRLERETVNETFVALQDFDDLMAQNFDEAPTAHSAERGEKLSDKDRLVLHRKRLERTWNDLAARLEQQRDELSAILVVYAERDRNFNRIEDPELERIVTSAFDENYRDEGPVFWIALMMAPVFLVYAAAVSGGVQALLGNVDPTVTAVLLTALLITCKIAILFLFPLVVVMGYRYYLLERDVWMRIDIFAFERPMMEQLLAAVALAFVTSGLLLALLAMLWAALVSSSEQRFIELFLGGSSPFLFTYLAQAGISAVQVAMVLIAIDTKVIHRIRNRLALAPFGFVTAALVLGYWALHTGFWYNFGLCGRIAGPDGSSVTPTLFQLLQAIAGGSLQWSTCYEKFEATDLLVYAFLSLGSAWFFIPSYRGSDVPEAEEPAARLQAIPAEPRTGAIPAARMKLTAGVLAAALLLTMAGAALAQSGGSSPTLTGPALRPADDEPTVVRVGFRADVEPFSYLQTRDGTDQYRGYLVDLCYRIFSTNEYRVEAEPVTVTNRFDSFRDKSADAGSPEPATNSGPAIDLLCDPVTMRFSKGDGREQGVFSPIVFISGVSYIKRQPAGGQTDVVMAFVEDTTAEETVRRICEADIFRTKADRESCAAIKSQPIQDCLADLATRPYREDGTLPRDQTARYFACTFPSHSDAIAWFCQNRLPGGQTVPDGRESRGGREANADLTKLERAYFGDRDIVIGKLESYTALGQSCSGVEKNFEPFSYEPYALVIRKDKPDLIRYVQRRVYEIFSNQSEAMALFADHFKDKQMTAPLGMLFLINAVEPEADFENSTVFVDAVKTARAAK